MYVDPTIFNAVNDCSYTLGFIQSVAWPARQFSSAMQISNFAVNEHENICIAVLNRRAGFATVFNRWVFVI